jgi:hypothetical protein
MDTAQFSNQNKLPLFLFLIFSDFNIPALLKPETFASSSVPERQSLFGITRDFDSEIELYPLVSCRLK